jgi:hypothetical protein
MRTDYLTSKLSQFLEDLSPRRVLVTESQRAREIERITAAVLKRAPQRGYEHWFDLWEERVQRAATAQTWPSVGDVHRAADALPQEKSEKSSHEVAAQAHIATGWLNRFGRAPSWMNSVALTNELLDRGVLTSLREARFKGFNLSPSQERAALKERMCDDEWERHLRILANLRGQHVAEVEVAEAKACKATCPQRVLRLVE